MIANSVGHNGVNQPDDVRRVKERLATLGFHFFPDTPKVEPGVIHAIKLFQSIISGRNRVAGVDGRVDVGLKTAECLWAGNAPTWCLMPDEGEGFVNFERYDTSDTHDYGTNWLAAFLVGAGARYQNQYRSTNTTAAKLTINDVSLPEGGDTPDHAGHETGLACDLRLPRTDGSAGGISSVANAAYDRAAMRAQLTSLRSQPLFKRALFNDAVLIDEGLCAHHRGHDDHVHVEIQPPSAIRENDMAILKVATTGSFDTSGLRVGINGEYVDTHDGVAEKHVETGKENALRIVIAGASPGFQFQVNVTSDGHQVTGVNWEYPSGVISSPDATFHFTDIVTVS